MASLMGRFKIVCESQEGKCEGSEAWSNAQDLRTADRTQCSADRHRRSIDCIHLAASMRSCLLVSPRVRKLLLAETGFGR
jgi:hypothetical protein